MKNLWILSILASFLLQSICLAEIRIGTVANAYPQWDFLVVRVERNLDFRVRDFLVIQKGDGSVYYAIVSAVEGDQAIADVHRDSEPSPGDRVLARFGYSSPAGWVTFRMPNKGRQRQPPPASSVNQYSYSWDAGWVACA